MSQEGNDNDNSGSGSSDGDAPLWKYVDKVEKIGTIGGSWKFQCNLCKDIRTGSYSRVRAHLLGIRNSGIAVCRKSNLDPSLRNEMRKAEEEFENRKKDSGPKEVPLPCDTQREDYLSKKRKSSLSPLVASFGVKIREQLDQEIARMFYTGGLSFNLAKNPHYYRSYQFAAEHKIDGYIPPSYNKLRTTLLQQEKKHVDSMLQPIKGKWKEKGVSIVSDGWSDPTRKPLINFMATSIGGPIFLKAVDCQGEVKDKFFIAGLMKEVINEIGHENVVQVITDNAANCKGAGEIISGLFPHIYWTLCVVHTLNLALKNICAAKNTESNQETYKECEWITTVHGDGLAIKHFIMNHPMRLAIFNKFSPLKLLSVGDTRFASIIVMLKRLKLLKRALQAMVISDEWTSYIYDDNGKASFVREKILNEEWWDKVSYILDFTRPIYDMIRLCDTDKPCLHLVYEMWDSMIEKVKIEIYKKEKRSMAEFCQFYEVVHRILVARWAKNNTHLHCLAHSLNPRFYCQAWLDEDSTRISPHRNAEVSLESMRCFKTLFPNDDDHARVLNEYALFSMGDGPFSDLSCITSMHKMPPQNWWANFGAQTPLLQGLAFKLLGQPSSSSCAERNWSTYSFIHSLRRNRLDTSRAQDLVYVHNNLRLLSRNPKDENGNDIGKMWDIAGDKFEKVEGEGLLELEDLSLDDPSFENELAQ